mmetsp:Transcript_37226/g.105074  ORF Transcript_37226/g.105074 Transcript_37226/m.105074 type:complete len:376 (-) Transcript_37226:1343-2470(-)
MSLYFLTESAWGPCLTHPCASLAASVILPGMGWLDARRKEPPARPGSVILPTRPSFLASRLRFASLTFAVMGRPPTCCRGVHLAGEPLSSELVIFVQVKLPALLVQLRPLSPVGLSSKIRGDSPVILVARQFIACLLGGSCTSGSRPLSFTSRGWSSLICLPVVRKHCSLPCRSLVDCGDDLHVLITKGSRLAWSPSSFCRPRLLKNEGFLGSGDLYRSGGGILPHLGTKNLYFGLCERALSSFPPESSKETRCLWIWLGVIFDAHNCAGAVPEVVTCTEHCSASVVYRSSELLDWGCCALQLAMPRKDRAHSSIWSRLMSCNSNVLASSTIWNPSSSTTILRTSEARTCLSWAPLDASLSLVKYRKRSRHMVML